MSHSEAEVLVTTASLEKVSFFNRLLYLGVCANRRLLLPPWGAVQVHELRLDSIASPSTAYMTQPKTKIHTKRE